MTTTAATTTTTRPQRPRQHGRDVRDNDDRDVRDNDDRDVHDNDDRDVRDNDDRDDGNNSCMEPLGTQIHCLLAPAYEGACNCRSPQMQELLMNCMLGL